MELRIVNPSRISEAVVILYNPSGYEGPELCFWERAKEGEMCEGCPEGTPAVFIARDLSAVGTHGDVGQCGSCWRGYLDDPSVLADCAVAFVKEGEY